MMNTYTITYTMNNETMTEKCNGKKTSMRRLHEINLCKGTTNCRMTRDYDGKTFGDLIGYELNKDGSEFWGC